MGRIWIVAGALAGCLAVALSAWAAHAAAVAPPETAHRLGQALTMQGWHALALVATGLLAERRAGWAPHVAGGAFLLGMVLFCGAVWSVALTGQSWGRLAPTGGTLLMLGWLALAVAAWRRSSDDTLPPLRR